MVLMTKLLEQAIANIQKLPEPQQNAAAEALFVHIAGEPRFRLTPEQVREVRRIQKNVRTGKTRLVSGKTMNTFWKKSGL